MVGIIQPLAKEFEIVGPDGKPTDYFIRWAQQRQIDIGQGISAAEAQQLINDWAAARDIIAGTALGGGGNLSSDVTLNYAGGIANQGDVDLSTPPTDGQVLVWDAGSSKWIPADQSGGGGGGGLTLISTQTLGAGAASVTFSSIPQNYKDLILVWSLRGDTGVANTDFFARFNGDTGANYDYEFVHWFSTGSSINQSTGQTAGRIASISAGSATANHASVGRLEIPNYRDTTFFKGAFSDFFSSLGTGAFSQGRGVYGFNWRSTAAVTSITVFPSAGNIIAGSTVSLYGRPATSGGSGGTGVWGPAALSGSGVLGSAFATHGMVFKPFVDITITGFTCYQQIAAGNTYRFFIAPMTSVSLDTDNHTLTGGTLGTEMYSQAFTNPTTANQTRVVELTTPQVLTAGTAYTIGIQRTDGAGTAVSQTNWTSTEYGSYGFPGEVYRRLYNISNSGSLSGLTITSIDTGTANALSLWPFGVT